MMMMMMMMMTLPTFIGVLVICVVGGLLAMYVTAKLCALVRMRPWIRDLLTLVAWFVGLLGTLDRLRKAQ